MPLCGGSICHCDCGAELHGYKGQSTVKAPASVDKHVWLHTDNSFMQERAATGGDCEELWNVIMTLLTGLTLSQLLLDEEAATYPVWAAPMLGLRASKACRHTQSHAGASPKTN